MDKSQVKIKDTVNLPKTDFPIRAGLAQKEPELLKFWQENKIYEKSVEQQKSYKEKFILHDGPPYPNGPIHLGHALNKILKDIVVRSKVMQGFRSDYIPGWDCHGLPIETQVIKDLKAKGKEEIKQDIPKFRDICKDFALNYVKTQRNEFIRLGIFGEWQKPYLTLYPGYEAKAIELFGQMADNGIVYQGRKPIHWCPNCETALAEAEIEYAEHRSPSIYFGFKVISPSVPLSKLLKGEAAEVLVWTTTPWTLPANVAISAHPDFKYEVIKANGKNYLLLQDLKDTLVEKLGFTDAEVIGTIKGKDLHHTQTQHPFIKRNSLVITGRHVTNEDGTGFVHTAPGHGQEDYIAGKEYDLPILMPVNHQGKFTDEAPEWEGISVFDANKPICEKMKENGSLLKLEFIKHSYPHCWRCKKPVIFRATEQWFIAMDKPIGTEKKTLREKALAKIKQVKWFPAWGEKRITSMIENRPDWCISRQRSWGLPIPVFICKKCENPEMKGEFNKSVVRLVQEKGANAWFTTPVEEILPNYSKCSKCNHNDFHKEEDILDVWFESGSSFAAVLENYPDMEVPAQVYLEGSDQHRGWFQSSLLIALGARDIAPYEQVITHGFTTDDKGRKMSKSMGNVIHPQNVIRDYGADILRWWVAASDFKGSDISIADSILKQARDGFMKTRNTTRFLLSNLFDFTDQDLLDYDQLNEIDKWILAKLNSLIKTATKAYDKYEFHIVTYRIHDFCAVTLSSLYLDMVKDRLYCDKAGSQNRRSTQTALYYILEALLKLIAPILVFTAEDAYAYFENPDKKESIHLEQIPALKQKYDNKELESKWEKLLAIKNQVYQKLEELRNNKEIKSFLEAKVELTLAEDIDFSDWAPFLIVSEVDVKKGIELDIKVTKSEKEKCERCWRFLDLENGLCVRCREAIK
ncbi:isoleucine--tRNA ligase [Candidatus Margulisiibacteriota bacterium]